MPARRHEPDSLEIGDKATASLRNAERDERPFFDRGPVAEKWLAWVE